MSSMPSVDNIVIQPYKERHVAGVQELLIDYFRTEEPLNKAVDLSVDESRDAFNEFALFCLEDNVSFVATDGPEGKVIGCRLNSIKLRDSANEHFDHGNLHPKMDAILTFLDILSAKLFSSLPDAQRVFKFEIVNVHPDYYRRGIAKKLIDVSFAKASELACDYISVTASSYKTQQMFEQMGFTIINTIDLQSYQYKGAHPFANIAHDNPVAKHLILKVPPAMGDESCLSNIEIKPFLEEHIAQVEYMLVEHFRLEEPMSRSLNPTPDDCRAVFHNFAMHSLQENVSFVALDGAKVVGCRLNTLVERPSDANLTQNFEWDENDGPLNQYMEIILVFLHQLSSKLFVQLPDAVKVFKFEIVNVLPTYYRRGIAKRLVDASFAKARAVRCDYVSTTATSIKTQQMFEQMGFTTLNTVDFRTYEYKNSRPFVNIAADNAVAKHMVKSIKY